MEINGGKAIQRNPYKEKLAYKQQKVLTIPMNKHNEKIDSRLYREEEEKKKKKDLVTCRRRGRRCIRSPNKEFTAPLYRCNQRGKYKT